LKKQLKDISFQTFDEVDPTSRFVMMQGYMWIKRYFSEGWLDYVFVSSLPGAKFLNSMNILAHFVPVGYHHGMGENQGMKRDIDVVFIGSTKNCRREGLLKTVCQKLKLNGMSIVIADHDCFGEQRTELLNRARISLNVVNHPWNLPGMRFLMSMGCGTLVISEPLEDPTPYKPGIHFVQTSVSDLPEAIKYYIENDDNREIIVRSASKFITEKLTLENSISQIMKVCYEDSTLPPGYI
jgi:glycosyltransferase involved in cell wall biosynthesis